MATDRYQHVYNKYFPNKNSCCGIVRSINAALKNTDSRLFRTINLNLINLVENHHSPTGNFYVEGDQDQLQFLSDCGNNIYPALNNNVSKYVTIIGINRYTDSMNNKRYRFEIKYDFDIP